MKNSENMFGFRLSDRQQECIDFKGVINKDLIIKGEAGSGKSTVLMLRANKYIQEAGNNTDDNYVIVFSFNKTLVSYMKELFTKAHGDKANIIKVSTLDSYLQDVFKEMPGSFKRYAIQDNRRAFYIKQALNTHAQEYGKSRIHDLSTDFWEREFDWIRAMNISVDDEEVYLNIHRKGRGNKGRIDPGSPERKAAFQIYATYEKLLAKKHMCEADSRYLYISHNLDKIPEKFKFEHVLIDEAQDQTLTKMKIVAALTKKDATISLDMNQKIYNQNWRIMDLGLKSTTKKLPVGFRCSPQIDAFAESLRSHNKPDEDDSIHIPSQSHSGPLPVIVKVRDLTEQKAYITKTLKEWMKTDPKATIAILYLKNNIGEGFQYLLSSAGIKYELIRRDSPFSALSPGVKLSTVFSAKGLEFTHVIIPDFNDGVYPEIRTKDDPIKEEEEREQYRNIAYVAFTRARKQLLITCYRHPSPYIDEIDSKYYVYNDTTGTQPVKKPDKKPQEKPVMPKLADSGSNSGKSSSATSSTSKPDSSKNYHISKLTDYFSAKGIETIDKRSNGGALWAVGTYEKLKPYIDEAEKAYGARFKYREQGGKVTSGRSAWWTSSEG